VSLSVKADSALKRKSWTSFGRRSPTNHFDLTQLLAIAAVYEHTERLLDARADVEGHRAPRVDQFIDGDLFHADVTPAVMWLPCPVIKRKVAAKVK